MSKVYIHAVIAMNGLFEIDTETGDVRSIREPRSMVDGFLAAVNGPFSSKINVEDAAFDALTAWWLEKRARTPIQGSNTVVNGKDPAPALVKQDKDDEDLKN